jgi:hypothetical protein
VCSSDLLSPGHEKEGLLSIEVNWLESWDGIMRAHPWLTSPDETYLGHTEKGGGALFEHSHGLDLGLYLWVELTKNAPDNITADFVWSDSRQFDEAVYVRLQSKGLDRILEVNQNVTTMPPIKHVSVSGSNWKATVEFSSKLDVFTIQDRDLPPRERQFVKSRESDFDREAELVHSVIRSHNPEAQTARLLSFERALDSSILGALALGIHVGDATISRSLRAIFETRLRSRA